jgi:lipid-binding SYLF domain-containing protein
MTGTSRVVVSVLAFSMMAGCTAAPASREGRDALIRQATAALEEWNRDIPGVEEFARRSYGYAVFPEIAKGGLGIGAAYGRGVVYEQGEHIGYADMSQASLGLQAGGLAYQILAVFDNQAALEQFKRGRLDFSADTSMVVLKTGYVELVRFVEGLMVFARPIGGVMGEAAIGGQRFTFVPEDNREPKRQPPVPATQ